MKVLTQNSEVLTTTKDTIPSHSPTCATATPTRSGSREAAHVVAWTIVDGSQVGRARLILLFAPA
jgi:hypothetical protein